MVLSRKRDESIVISGGIRITIVEIRGDKVRLGVEAPREITVARQELVPHWTYRGKGEKPLDVPDKAG